MGVTLAQRATQNAENAVLLIYVSLNKKPFQPQTSWQVKINLHHMEAHE
jgi:hypothetical protein